MIKDTPSLGRMAAMIGVRVLVRGHPALPVAGLRRLDPAASGGLPLRGQVHRGGPAREGGRHPDRRASTSARSRTSASTPRAAPRSPRWRSRRSTRRCPPTRRPSFGSRPCWARPTWSSRRATRARGCWRTAARLPNAAIEKAVEIDEIISLFDRPTRTQLPRLDPRAGHRDRQGTRRGPQRRDRQPAAVRGQRRRRARGARRRGAGAARAGAQLRAHARGGQRAPRPAAPADRATPTTPSTRWPRATSRWPRRS